MRVAIVAPESSDLKHRVRGTGFYFKNLVQFLRRSSGIEIVICSKDNIPVSVDLVHYPYFEPFFLTTPFMKRQKIVVTVHDLTPLKFPKHFPVGIRGWVKWKIQKMALKRTEAIITDSKISQADIVDLVGVEAEKVHAIYLAAGKEFRQLKNKMVQERVRVRYNLPRRFALYVGDATWNKNLPRLISAVKEANLALVMVGQALVQKDFDRKNPWNQDLLKVQKMTENDKRIIKLGFISSNDLVVIYNLAEVFVMPSLYEGFGLPVLEAMKCGCPVITSREGSLPEVAGDAAYYVDAYDVNSIASGIKEVIENKKLQKDLSKRGIAQAKKFSWQETVEETVQVYKSL